MKGKMFERAAFLLRRFFFPLLSSKEAFDLGSEGKPLHWIECPPQKPTHITSNGGRPIEGLLCSYQLLIELN